MQKFRKKQTAFTMPEVLIVVALFATLSIAIYQAFANGLKIWDYGEKFFGEEDVVIFLEKIEDDLHNAFFYSLIPIEGSAKALEFATRVVVPTDPESGIRSPYVNQIGKVRYSLNKRTQQIERQVFNYGLAVKGKFLKKQVLAKNIRTLRFSYFYLTDQGLTQEEEAETIIPCQVAVDVEYFVGDELRKMVKLINVPIGL
ncbi:MAG: prepilin-type N-terminal cleavage/methylation domain-containing protein [Candidatus Aceula meridiana]|nr:prepilin-type N-terminal cleavage/methylation domain-containing protein [Candidatus Aceula meridiana]